MKRFLRGAAPTFWGERERDWKASDPRSSGKDALRNRTREGRSLARWFHDQVRAAGEPHNCAYCDGSLRETSPETIDHFIPEHLTPELGLAWRNLYPACVTCNTTHKGVLWDMCLLRPEDVEEHWFDFDPEHGTLAPSIELDPLTAWRVIVTIGLLGLNEEGRCHARRRAWKVISASWHAGHRDFVSEQLAEGPYRLVVQRFIAAASQTAVPSRR